MDGLSSPSQGHQNAKLSGCHPPARNAGWTRRNVPQHPDGSFQLDFAVRRSYGGSRTPKSEPLTCRRPDPERAPRSTAYAAIRRSASRRAPSADQASPRRQFCHSGKRRSRRPREQTRKEQKCKRPANAGLRKRLKGLEPSTCCMASSRSSQLSYSREEAECSGPSATCEGRDRSPRDRQVDGAVP